MVDHPILIAALVIRALLAVAAILLVISHIHLLDHHFLRVNSAVLRDSTSFTELKDVVEGSGSIDHLSSDASPLSLAVGSLSG